MTRRHVCCVCARACTRWRMVRGLPTGVCCLARQCELFAAVRA